VFQFLHVKYAIIKKIIVYGDFFLKIDKHFYPVFLVAFLYFITGTIRFWLIAGEKIITVGVFPPEGIALAFALFYGKKVLPGIFIGQFFLAFTNGINFFPAVEVSLINSFEAYLGIYFFNKFKLSLSLNTFRDIIGLALIILLILQPFSAILSNTMLLLHQQTDAKMFFHLVFSWWFGNVLGQFLTTPFVLLLFTKYEKTNLKELLLYSAVYIIYLYLIIIIFNISNPFLLISFSVSFMIFVLIKKDLFYGVLFSVIATAVASFSIHIQTGAFSSASLHDNTVNFNLFVLTHIVLSWLVGILFEERKNFENYLHSKIEEEVEKNKKQQFFLLQQNRLAQMGELISMIAHQWRQPLNNLSLSNQLLITKYRRHKLDESTMQYFEENSKKQITLMSETIDDFRNFFKIEENMKEFSLNKTINSVLDITEPVFKSDGIFINYIPQKEIKLFGHSNTLRQVILNILNNAKDALLEQHSQQKEIFININEDETKIYISIEDTAGGIPENIIDKIFDPYFSTKQEKNGTGLGLYMSKMIIEDQMKAKLNVENTLNGAKFTIIFQKEND